MKTLSQYINFFPYSITLGIKQLPGDILIISCFISYVGCFTRAYRVELYSKMWMPTFYSMQVKKVFNNNS